VLAVFLAPSSLACWVDVGNCIVLAFVFVFAAEPVARRAFHVFTLSTSFAALQPAGLGLGATALAGGATTLLLVGRPVYAAGRFHVWLCDDGSWFEPELQK
jgi:hypothetical protein